MRKQKNGLIVTILVAIIILLTTLLILLLSGRLDLQKEKIETPKTDVKTEVKTEQTLLQASLDVIKYLSTSDLDALAKMIHTEKGLHFSPYAFVDPTKDLAYNQDTLPKLLSDTALYTWGSYDGSGEPMDLSPSEYYEKFVWDVDYSTAPMIGQNTRIGFGNTLFNLQEVYPDASFVEFHFPGFDEQYEGIDWCSLILVFEKSNDQWQLIYIIHDQWTI